MKTILQNHFGKEIYYLREENFQENRKIALVRDRYTCQKCLKKDVKLLVHHKDESGDGYMYNPINNKLSNLMTLCHRCHSKIHGDLNKIRGQGYIHK